MEGYLDKHLKPFGKNKLWCSVRNDGFSYQKGQNSRNPEVIKFCDIQMVRKKESDRSGLQFDLQTKNKITTYSAPTQQDCNAWVTMLHSVMHEQSPRLCDYEEIGEVLRTPSASDNRFTTSGYVEISDLQIRPSMLISPPITTSLRPFLSPSIDEVNPYATTSLIDNLPPREVEQAVTSCVPQSDLNSPTDVEDEKPNLPLVSNETKRDQAGYALINKVRNFKAPEQMEDQGPKVTVIIHPATDVEEGGGEEEDVFSPEIEDSVDDLYSDAFLIIPSSFSPVPPIYHLTEEDLKPLEDMKHFLANNDHLLHKASKPKETLDPFKELREFLEKLPF